MLPTCSLNKTQFLWVSLKLNLACTFYLNLLIINGISATNMILRLIFFCLLVSQVHVGEDLKAFLSYEDLIPCDDHEDRVCHNFLTFKEPVYPDGLLKLSEFTVCWRIKVLTYNKGSLHLFGGNEPDNTAPSDLPFMKTSRNMHFDLSAPGSVWESIIRMDTYKEGDVEIAKNNGIYVTFVDYKENINSNE